MENSQHRFKLKPYKLRDGPDELAIGVRFLRPALAAVMLSVLTLFWAGIIDTEGPSAPLFVVLVVTSCFALFIALYTSWVSVKPGVVTTWSGPIPFGLKTRDAADVDEIFSTLVRVATGRGVIERYSLMATIRFSGGGPVLILEGFMRQDADEAGGLLADKLNQHRRPDLAPVDFRPS